MGVEILFSYVAHAIGGVISRKLDSKSSLKSGFSIRIFSSVYTEEGGFPEFLFFAVYAGEAWNKTN